MAGGRVISDKDYPVIEQMVQDYTAGRLTNRPWPGDKRRTGGDGGGSQKVFATIVRSLQRPDPTTSPATEAITCYKIKLATSEEYDEWSGTHGLYEEDDLVLWTDGLDYRCLTDHTAAESKSPANPAYWECACQDAYVLGYPYDDLLGGVPWFEVDAEVEVVYRDGEYRICETVERCEEIVDDQLSTSVQWNADENRVMAVYK